MDPSVKHGAVIQQFKILEDLIRSFATKEEFSAFFAREQKCWTTKKNSWRENQARIVPPQHDQGEVGNCWAIGLFRQWYSLSVLAGRDPTRLTVEKLTKGISSLHKSEDEGLDNWDVVIEYMKSNDFLKDMRVHYKPSGLAEAEEYEKFLLRLCKGGPVAVGFNNFPSYTEKNPGFRILSPSRLELVRSGFEINYQKHVGLLMGPGIDVDGNEYLEIYETSGENWGDSGFIRLAMHQGLINFSIEMEF